MKINQVEELAGVTKKNIRFYEEQGLLKPERNPENGYREYTLKDVDSLKKVKLLRKLNVPIEEIRMIHEGALSFSECMERQSKRLKAEQEGLAAAIGLCDRLNAEVTDFERIDASLYLSELKKLEEGGAVFMDISEKDVRKRSMTGAVLAGGIFIFFLLAIVIGTCIAAVHDPIPPGVVAILVAPPVVGIILTVVVLALRIKEIRKGEAYDARNY